MNPTSSDASPVLEIRGLRKAYGPVIAVADVDLAVAAGEVVGLVGKNGAGKSSLIKVVTGAIQADAGTISMNGQEVNFRGPADARRRGLAFVHQELALIESESIAENIALGGGLPHRRGTIINWRALRQHSQQLQNTVDIGDLDPRTRVSALTSVQKRQVMIAAALWHPASVLILDEPTASLSEHEVEILHGIVRRLSQQGTGILYVSHRLDEVIGLTDRVVVMRDGAVVDEESTESLNKPRLVAMITGGAAPTRAPAAAVSTSQDVVLDVEGVTSDHAPTPVSFQVRAGEILGIAGLVGSGRSELLRAIYGADHRLSGRVTVAGQVVAHNPHASLRAGLAYLSEDRLHSGLITDFTVARNMTLARMDRVRRRTWLAIPSRRMERAVARQSVDDLSIKTSSVDAPVMSLSGGNQQKVLLGRWLLTEPRVLLLDEPTLGIDVEAKAEIYELLRELASQGLGLVVVSSEFVELELLCSRALVMQESAIVAELAGDEITELNLLHHCFGSRDTAELDAS